MTKGLEEWLKQSHYDMKTAEKSCLFPRDMFMLFFMCHLFLEKALKGLYQKRLGALPPKFIIFFFSLRQSV